MSSQAMLWGWTLVGHTPAAKLLAIWIGDCSDESGIARIAIKRACDWTGLSEADFGAALGELSISGLGVGPDEAGYVSCQVPIAVNVPPTKREVRMRDSRGHLYVITADAKTKVGISRDVDSRLMWLQSGNPNPISVAFTLRDDSIRRLRSIEREVHLRLAEHRISGEWFDIAPTTVIGIVRAVDAVVPK